MRLRSIASSHASGDETTVCLYDVEERLLAEVQNFFHKPASLRPRTNYQVVILTHQQWPESQIRILQEQDHDIGHIFSAAALSSAESPLLLDRFAAGAGYTALHKICAAQTFNDVDLSLKSSSEVTTIDQLLPDNSVIAVVSDERRLQLNGSHGTLDEFIEDRLLSFASEGLYPHSIPARETFGTASTELPIARRSLGLVPLSGDLPQAAKDYISQVIVRAAPFQERPEFRFFLYYQTCELLVEEVRMQMAAGLGRALQTATASTTWDLIEKFRDDLVMSKRLERVLNPLQRQPLFEEVRSACNEVTIEIGESAQDSCAASVYRVRNLLFHRFADASRLSNESLGTAADALLRLILHIAQGYKAIPDGTATVQDQDR